MAVLAIKLAGHANGVSQLHGEVSRAMWKNVWPELPEEQLPLNSITNGVHTRTWMSNHMTSLLIRYLGTRWMEDPTDHNVWRRISKSPMRNCGEPSRAAVRSWSTLPASA